MMAYQQLRAILTSEKKKTRDASARGEQLAPYDSPCTVENEEPHGRTEGFREELVFGTGEMWMKP